MHVRSSVAKAATWTQALRRLTPSSGALASAPLSQSLPLAVRLAAAHKESSVADTIAPVRPAAAGLGFFERYLSLWVALCMVAGIFLGRILPALVDALRSLEVG